MLLVASTLDLDDHDPGEFHPEQVRRLKAAVSALEQPRFAGAVEWLPSRVATRDELLAVHDGGYLNGLMDLCAAGGGPIDPDTAVSRGSWETACLTAGAGLQAIDAVAAGRAPYAVVLGRPPGHHASRAGGMGFCLVNNVAVAAAALSAAGERVAIVDWDVHHGNGTQDIFWEDGRVLYTSLHQWPLYPGTGRARERGAGPGLGSTINLPLPPRTTGDVYLALLDEVVLPELEKFAPGWLLISAGFDAHREDPLGEMRLTAADFSDMTARLQQIESCGNRMVLFLEGGYDPEAVGRSVGACAARLLDLPYRPEEPSSGGNGMSRVADYQRMFAEDEAQP